MGKALFYIKGSQCGVSVLPPLGWGAGSALETTFRLHSCSPVSVGGANGAPSRWFILEPSLAEPSLGSSDLLLLHSALNKTKAGLCVWVPHAKPEEAIYPKQQEVIKAKPREMRSVACEGQTAQNPD